MLPDAGTGSPGVPKHPEEAVSPRSWKRLVYVTRTGKTYHLATHEPSYTVTWTQRFAHEGLGYAPCQTCFRGTRPRHHGRLVELDGTIEWQPA
jgi:hypothetical protein